MRTASSPLKALLLGAVFCMTAACSQFNVPRLFTPAPPQQVIPASVTLVLDDSVKTALFEYTACADIVMWKGHLGDSLVRAFQDMGQTRFTHFSLGEAPAARQTAEPGIFPVRATVKLTHKSFTSRTRTGADDRYMAQLDIHLVATFYDTQGQPLPDAPLNYSEAVSVFTPQFGASSQCATQDLDELLRTAAGQLAAQFPSYVEQLIAKQQRQTESARQTATNRPSQGEASPLTVKVTLLDDNQNLILESSEKVRVRIDVTNTGTAPTNQAFATFSGTPALTEAFAGTLTAPVTIPALQPGESTSAMVVGQLPARFDGTRGELTVTISSADTKTGPLASQTLVATMAPIGAPAAAAPSAGQSALSSGAIGQGQNRYAVAVGLSLYRSPWAGWRDGLSFDSKGTISLIAQSLNVPDSHTLLLQDELASQEDIEEALASWLPKQMGKDSIVFFYFNGQALADPKTGEVYLIPYDGTPASSRSRLISLRWLQSRLQKLGAKLALSIIETPLATGALSKDGKPKSVTPNWIADLDGSSGQTGRPLIQVAGNSGSSRQQNSLLSGLTGPADLDHDGIVTLGEWLRSLRGSAVTVPALPPALGVQSIPLSRVNQR
ncbi:hypothetical protein ACO9S2_05895 [Nitrospira sp. NS4]|uniref:hypothetical protein n=1 Tax=Nitrospira sp. NS4 TaxID=3414498 RepID=UPI003C2D5B02